MVLNFTYATSLMKMVFLVSDVNAMMRSNPPATFRKKFNVQNRELLRWLMCYCFSNKEGKNETVGREILLFACRMLLEWTGGRFYFMLLFFAAFVFFSRQWLSSFS